MKKVFAAIMAAAIISTVGGSAFAAKGDLSRIIISSPKVSTTVTESYSAGMDAITKEANITALMKQLKNLTATKSVVQTIKIDSKNMGTYPVKLWLNLELPVESEYAQASQYSAVDYYSVKIENKYGRVIYDDAEANAETGSNIKSIELGTLNESHASEEADYSIYVSVNKNVDVSKLSSKPEDVEWKIVYTDDAKSFEATTAPQQTSTAQPSGQTTTNNGQTGVTATVAPTGATASPSTEEKTITIYCADETSKNYTQLKNQNAKIVAPGAYKLVGEGNVLITNSDSNKKIETHLVPESKIDTVSTLPIAEGDIITVTGTNPKISFKSPNSTAASAKPSASPKATATTKPTATPKATATTAPKATEAPKTNPKTGDATPIVGVSILGISALAAAAYVGISSKKKNK